MPSRSIFNFEMDSPPLPLFFLLFVFTLYPSISRPEPVDPGAFSIGNTVECPLPFYGRFFLEMNQQRSLRGSEVLFYSDLATRYAQNWARHLIDSSSNRTRPSSHCYHQIIYEHLYEPAIDGPRLSVNIPRVFFQWLYESTQRKVLYAWPQFTRAGLGCATGQIRGDGKVRLLLVVDFHTQPVKEKSEERAYGNC